MQFSVVIPLFNKGPHVEGTIRSVLAQTHAPLEIIVVDDESTDNGLAVVQAMDDPRIRIFTRSPPGPGGYAARNLGIEQARGDWIAFIDADDDWTPDHLAGLARAVSDCAGPVGCVFSRLVTVSGGVEQAYPVSERYLVPGQPLSLAVMLRAWLDSVLCPMWTGAVAFRRDLLMEAGLFPAGRARRGGDKDLWLRCFAREDVAYHPVVTARFHQDTVNRVSNNVGHATVPIITESIRDLIPSAAGETRTLLRKLHNQEVRLYAKYAVGKGQRVSLSYLRNLYLPEGAALFAYMLGLVVAGPAITAVLRRRRR